MVEPFGVAFDRQASGRHRFLACIPAINVGDIDRRNDLFARFGNCGLGAADRVERQTRDIGTRQIPKPDCAQNNENQDDISDVLPHVQFLFSRACYRSAT